MVTSLGLNIQRQSNINKIAFTKTTPVLAKTENKTTTANKGATVASSTPTKHSLVTIPSSIGALALLSGWWLKTSKQEILDSALTQFIIKKNSSFKDFANKILQDNPNTKKFALPVVAAGLVTLFGAGIAERFSEIQKQKKDKVPTGKIVQNTFDSLSKPITDIAATVSKYATIPGTLGGLSMLAGCFLNSKVGDNILNSQAVKKLVQNKPQLEKIAKKLLHSNPALGLTLTGIGMSLTGITGLISNIPGLFVQIKTKDVMAITSASIGFISAGITAQAGNDLISKYFKFKAPALAGNMIGLIGGTIGAFGYANILENNRKAKLALKNESPEEKLKNIAKKAQHDKDLLQDPYTTKILDVLLDAPTQKRIIGAFCAMIGILSISLECFTNLPFEKARKTAQNASLWVKMLLESGSNVTLAKDMSLIPKICMYITTILGTTPQILGPKSSLPNALGAIASLPGSIGYLASLESPEDQMKKKK